MVKIVGVRFRTAGKIYFFDPLQFELKRGDNVIVETARGIEFGTVVSEIREVDESAVVQPLKPILRIASQRDKEQEAGNKIKEREAFKICQEKIRKHELEMKLIDAEYTFDNNKVLFYFTADGRIDFRELVKDLAGVFRTRIELRQIGVRDETKIMGGLGICGRPLCCHTYLSDFNAVSIKMAKEQNLSLNPTKISGVCGRLMCCLKNEQETYEDLNRRLPGIGDRVLTEDGQRGEVQSVNVLRQLVKVLIENGDDKELKEFEVEKLRFQKRHNKKDRQNLSEEELKELELLEQQEELELQAAEQDAAEKSASRREASAHGSRESDKDRRQGRGNKGERGERKEQNEGRERSKHEKANRDQRENQEKGSRQGHGNKPENGERQERGTRQGKGDRQDKGNHQPKGDRQDKGNRQEKGEHQGKNRNRQERQGGGERGESQEQNHGDKNRLDRGERPGKNRNRQDRQDHGKQPDSGMHSGEHGKREYGNPNRSDKDQGGHGSQPVTDGEQG